MLEIEIYKILPLISAIFMIALGLFVIFKAQKSKLSIIFGLFSITVVVWLFSTYMMFKARDEASAIFWDRTAYAGVVFIPTLMYHFSLVLTNTKGQRKILYLGYISSSIFLFLSRTNYFVADLYKYSWGIHTQARFFHSVFLIIFFIYILLFFYNIYRYYKKTQLASIEYFQTKYVFLAFVILAIGSLAYLPAYNIDVVPITYLAELIGSLLLAYAILKHHLMNIKVIATEIFTLAIIFILAVQAFTAPAFGARIVNISILGAVSFFGYLLIRGVLSEVRRREELENLSSQLATTNVRLDAAYKELQKLDKAKSEFISMASHQLRTPLTAIKGYLSMLLEGSYGQVSSKARDKVKNVFQSSERLIRIINDLLNISRIELGKMEVDKEPTQIEELIQSCYDELKIGAEKKGLKMIFKKPKELLPKIMVDPLKIRQVVSNLIDNALHYTKKGEIEIAVQKKEDSVLISVKDTGEGMTKEEQKNIFQGFSRGSAGIAYFIEGAGLGLYVAKKFLELHQGRIWAESEGKGKGSVFYVELPIA